MVFVDEDGPGSFGEVRVLRGSWGRAKEGWLGFSDSSVDL